MAYTAYKGVRMLKGLVNVERKFFDKNFSGPVINTGVITPLNDMAAGDDNTNRQGNSILGKYLTGKLIVTIAPDATAITAYVRCIIFMDLSNQGVAPTMADILQIVTITNAIVSPKNNDNTDRFWTLYDKVYSVDKSGDSTIHRKFYIPINTHLKYNSTAAGVDTNAIYMLLFSDQDQALLRPIVSWHSRLAFYDN